MTDVTIDTVFLNPRKVVIDETKFTVAIRVEDADGQPSELIVSADHGLTGGSGIWVGTRDAYHAALEVNQ